MDSGQTETEGGGREEEMVLKERGEGEEEKELVLTGTPRGRRRCSWPGSTWRSSRRR